jgi:hypothetical protein
VGTHSSTLLITNLLFLAAQPTSTTETGDGGGAKQFVRLAPPAHGTTALRGHSSSASRGA